MTDTTLTVTARSVLGTRPSGRDRRDGKIPAVVYGLGESTQHVTVQDRELTHILASATGSNTLITLEIDGSSHLALARQIQRHPVRGNVLHVDFIRVRADEEVQAEVPLRLVGEAQGVRNGGVLDQALFSLTVMARPTDLPPSIELDVSDLDIGDQLRVSDVTPPSGVTITVEAEELVASITVPSEIEEAEPELTEEELEALEGLEGVEGEGEAEGAAEGTAESESESGSDESE